MIETKGYLSGFSLKTIAIVTMLIDHIGAVLFPQYLFLRVIGRISFPIFCFLVVEGAMHTSDIKKYFNRLLIFALISEIPFNLAIFGTWFFPYSQNVFFTLALGLAAIIVVQKYMGSAKSVFLIIGIMLISELLHTDYSFGGVCMILAFYLFYNSKWKKALAFILVNALIFGGLQLFASVAIIPILLYNGKRGMNIKYAFYIFYPLHLLILFLLRQYIL